MNTSPTGARHATVLPHLLRRLLVMFAAGLALVLAVAGPAAAHAVLTGSTPPDKSKLPTSPPEVVLTFSEPISIELGGLKVLDAAGKQVDNGDSTLRTPTNLAVTLPPDLPDGTYVANYKAVSADGHAISGAIVFGVGNANLADVSGVVASNDPTMEALGAFARFLMYVGALLAAGIAFFLGFIHDRAGDWGPLGTWVRVCSAVAAVGAFLIIAVQAALATGEGLSAAFNATTLREVLRQGVGWQTAFLLVGLALCQAALVTRSRIVAQGLIFYGSIAIVSSFVWWGHATESPHSYLAAPADVIHAATAAIWFGGLIGLAVTLRGRSRAAMAAAVVRAGAAPAGVGDEVAEPAGDTTPLAGDAGAVDVRIGRHDADSGGGSGDGDDGDDGKGGGGGDGDGDGGEDDMPAPGSLASTVLMIGRFSTVAAASVVVLSAAGLALAWSEAGSLSALADSTYGKLLFGKIAAVGIILFVAAFNRWRLLPWLLGDAEDELADEGTTGPEGSDLSATDDAPANRWRPLINTTLLELAGIVVVLGLTSVLVNATPPASIVTPSAPFQESQPFRDGKMLFTITPNRPGTNDLHLELIGPDGRPYDPARQVTVEFRLPEKDIGPITREFPKDGVGHFVLEDVNDLSIPGTWQITIISRITDFEQETNVFTDTIS